MKNNNILSKPDVIGKLRSTRLLPEAPSVFIEKWIAEDTQQPIYWSTAVTPVGEVLVAATKKGVCFLGFSNDHREWTFKDLRRRFPSNPISEKKTQWHDEAFSRINDPLQLLPIHLHLKGTDFQLGIWEQLIRVPFGGLITYSDLGNGARYARATGTAVGANPVSLFVPCHRAVRADGSYDAYYWGPERKKLILAYEAGLIN